MFNRGNNGGVGNSVESTGNFAGTSSVETEPRTRSDTSEYRSQKNSVNNNINTSAGGLQQGLQPGYLSNQQYQQVDFSYYYFFFVERKFI